MRRRIALVGLASLLVPASAFAKIDPTCSTTTATSAIGGVVEDALGQPLQGLKVELYQPNREIPTADSAITGADGRYRICAGEASGSGHDTYNVHVRDLRPAPTYAMAAQPYTTYTDLGDADFTQESGYPLLTMTNLSVAPNEISTAAGPAPVTWLVRSKAASGTLMRLTLGHPVERTVTMTPDGEEDNGPASGGWNRWTYSEVIPAASTERLYWASARGFDPVAQGVQTTQRDRQPYAIDNTPPLLGPASAQPAECGPSVVANGFSPASPPGTTNPLPIVTHGVCDHWSNGARSGVDPYSLRGKICTDARLTTGCVAINPVLNAQNIVWYPSEPLALGNYYFGWRVADFAGNITENPLGYKLSVVARGGQVPTFSGLQPGTFGSGTSGIVIGSSVTSPSSYPYIGFRVLDADGQRDLAPGTLQARVFYGDERTLVYEYDITKNKNDYDPVSKKGGASWDLSSGIFRADGYPLQGKPPGRYIATATVTDNGGNNATITWVWILALAI